MRSLKVEEMEVVSGGWEWTISFGDFVEVSGTGEELAAGYDWCVSQMSDFFTWWDPAGYYGPVGC
jgi:hypothetical protein